MMRRAARLSLPGFVAVDDAARCVGCRVFTLAS